MKIPKRVQFILVLLLICLLAVSASALMSETQPAAAQSFSRPTPMATPITSYDLDGWISGATTSRNPQTHYSFQGTAGQYVTIQMAQARGSSIDPWLDLLDPSGRLVAYDDDGAGRPNSLISNYRLQRSGNYRIIARSYQDSTSGAYWLYVTLYR